jgi:cobalt-zinc-cadmium efflux system membrane fusion protein
MTRNIALSIGLIASMTFHPSIAEEIIVTPNEIRNLGIEFSAPEVASEVAAIEATARVVIPPMGDAIVSAPHAGLLAGLNVSVGEEVTRGQVMAKLQSSDFLVLQREFLDALNANLLTRNEFQRDQQLFDEGIISGRRLQETTTRSRIAATSFNEHRQLLQIAGLSDSEIQSLENEQKLSQVLEIRAPFDGVILDRMATAGERLDAMSPVYRLGDLSVLWLEITVPQEKLAAVQPGMRVGVTDSAIQLPAEVTAIGRSIDPATQAVMVRATLTETGHGLKPGQFVSVRIVAGHAGGFDETVWVVPAAAVISSGGSHYLFVRTANGFDVRYALILGANADHAYLNVDIDADDSIAVIGVSALKALWLAQSESDG